MKNILPVDGKMQDSGGGLHKYYGIDVLDKFGPIHIHF